ncbi:MAG: AmmeMemoRadiSam system protein A [Holophagales bacterium]|nr:AmmeMemoRadiSam system protein A [Holophagales bacterium]
MTPEAPSPDPTSPERRSLGSELLRLARDAVSRVVATGIAEPEAWPEEAWAKQPGATFVTLRSWDLDWWRREQESRGRRVEPTPLPEEGALRGCLGSLEPRRPLAHDVWANAVAAATRDPRFLPVVVEELPWLSVEVSLLGPRQSLHALTEEEARRQLRPGVDGVVLSWREHRATFLPQVWEQLQDPGRFLAELREKAGLRADFWHPDLRIERYAVEKWAEERADPSKMGAYELGEEVEMEVGDVLDLHSFPPREIGDLVRHYLELARERGLTQLRIVHGKGVGVQRRRVRSILDKHPHVVAYGDPPGESGGWGATWVELAPAENGQEAGEESGAERP